MRAEEQFDSFYLKTRRALVHQTFALTGDLPAARRAVRDAYVMAWHHWRKVHRQEDQVSWVRPRAWSLAQRRHTARLWHRTRDLSAEDRTTLDALHKLPVTERRALLLVDLADVPFEVAARELGVTRDLLRQQVQVARARFAALLDMPVDEVAAPILALGGAAAGAALPRPAGVRRQGRNRRRSHAVVASAAATLCAIASGAFAHEPPSGPLDAEPAVTKQRVEPGPPAPVAPVPEPTLPTGEDLLTARDLRGVAPVASWREPETHDNTSGTGLNYVCQQQRFADPDGLSTLVRELRTRTQPERSVVQSVEISRSSAQAEDAFASIESWFAICEGGELHLRRTYAVTGVADEARLMRLRAWGGSRAAYWAGIARVDEVVTTVVVRSIDQQAPPPARAARLLDTAAERLCERLESTACEGRPELEAVPPPLGTAAPGLLTTIDLPPLSEVGKPWVGTEAEPTRGNPASTSCDRARFRRAGAESTRTRTFLVPEARLPDRFGLTETYGTFPSRREAARFMRTIRDRFAACEDRDLATEVLASRSLRTDGMDGSTWRLRTELSESREVYYDVGFVRRGDTVAQLTFVPAERADLAPGAFRALVVRAGQRLAQLE